MNTYQKQISLNANGVRDDQCMLTPADGSIFTAEEWQAIGEAIAYKGTYRATWRKTGCRFGTPGYIFQQARTMAISRYRMPSECVLLFTDRQRRLFWSLANKMTELVSNKYMAVQFQHELHKRFKS